VRGSNFGITSQPEAVTVLTAIKQRMKRNQKKENEMAIIAKDNTSEFPKLPLPEAGTVRAVCCAVWDLGMQKTSFNGKERLQHKIIIAWEIEEKINAPESEYHGKAYMLNKRYTLSLADKANLRHDLESWRGKPFTAAELEGFDVEVLYGVNCLLGVKHEPSKDGTRTYANVSAILPLTKGMEKIKPERARDEPPPKWVIELQDQAQIVLSPDAVPYDGEYQEDNPF
jgi:hypothetical protein